MPVSLVKDYALAYVEVCLLVSKGIKSTYDISGNVIQQKEKWYKC